MMNCMRWIGGVMCCAVTFGPGSCVWADVPWIAAQDIALPGEAFAVPGAWNGPNGAPRIFEYSKEAGPDESLFVVGDNLTRDVLVYGGHADRTNGALIRAKVQFASSNYLAFTIDERASDGPYVLSVQNVKGAARPVVINAPELWWQSPATLRAGGVVRLFGRNLSRRPDFSRAFVWLENKATQKGLWLDLIVAGKYTVSGALPEDLPAGDYALRVHAGQGGVWGWSEPLDVRIEAASEARRVARTLKPEQSAALQETLDSVAKKGGGCLMLRAGTYPFSGTLRIPAGVTLAGEGKDRTVLQLVRSQDVQFQRFNGVGWNLAPEAIHCVGDTLRYAVTVPEAGEWSVWVRYATDMSPWKMDGVSGKSVLHVNDDAPVTLQNLPNTGSFGTFRWSRCAVLKLAAGKQNLVWKNVGGGGMTLDAFVFCRGDLQPSDRVWPQSGPACVVVQAEDCTAYQLREGRMPGSSELAAVWLSGDGAGIAGLSIYGTAQVNYGLLVRAEGKPDAWVTGCTATDVRVADIDGKKGENCGLMLRNVRCGDFCGNELVGRVPVFLSGVRDTRVANNRLVSVTRFGGNAEAAILSRTQPLERSIIENNVYASLPGTGGGGGTARRMIWVSTGRGSVAHNWFGNNRVECEGKAGQPRFSGVAGTDQNVGEMILFEGHHRTMYFGPLVGADAQSVVLPKTLPHTPDSRLGSVKREQLAHNAAGEETPFWPPLADDGTVEPTQSDYFVTIFAGAGQGQTRRVLGRDGERLLLDRPWRVQPTAGAVVAIGTMFYQNHVVDNTVPDGMTGVQLWISCVENIVAQNSVARQRKPLFFLYANGTTLASSMPCTWNRGISPLFWNTVEGNRAEECSDGVLVTSGDAPQLPIEFPRALGNVVRRNSLIRLRAHGVTISGRSTVGPAGYPIGAIAGTLAEFNLVRDAGVAYFASGGGEATLFRRDHAYFWYPVSTSAQAPVGFWLQNTNLLHGLEQNTVEGTHGVFNGSIVEQRLGE